MSEGDKNFVGEKKNISTYYHISIIPPMFNFALSGFWALPIFTKCPPLFLIIPIKTGTHTSAKSLSRQKNRGGGRGVGKRQRKRIQHNAGTHAGPVIFQYNIFLFLFLFVSISVIIPLSIQSTSLPFGRQSAALSLRVYCTIQRVSWARTREGLLPTSLVDPLVFQGHAPPVSLYFPPMLYVWCCYTRYYIPSNWN